MRHVAQLRACPRLLVQAGLRVGGRFMGCVAALLAPESTSGSRPTPPSAPPPSLGLSFCEADASMSVPSTLKCSSDISPKPCAATTTRPKLRVRLSVSSRSRLWVKVEWSHTAFDPQPHEAAEQQIEVQLLHELPLTAHGVEDLQERSRNSRSGGIEGP